MRRGTGGYSYQIISRSGRLNMPEAGEHRALLPGVIKQ